MRPVTVTVGPLAAASANAVALSQTPTTGFTLNGSLASGGVATLDTPRRLLVTTGADESGKTITFTGTDRNGSPITEVMTGPNNTTGQTTLDYKTVTSIATSATFAAAATVGTSGVASSMWVRLDSWAPAPTSVQCVVSGTVNYSVQGTLQDPNSATDPVSPYLITWFDSPDPNVVGATTSQASYYTNPPLWVKVTLNSGSGSVSAVIVQNSSVPL